MSKTDTAEWIFIHKKPESHSETAKVIDILNSIRSDSFLKNGLRTLTDIETRTLEAQGNICEDWSKIKVVPSFEYQNIINNHFIGDCIIGSQKVNKKIPLYKSSINAGIYYSVICNSIISDEVLIYHSPLIESCVVFSDVRIFNSSCICSETTNFGIGIEVSLGLETGEKDIPVFFDIDYSRACEFENVLRQPDVHMNYRDAITRLQQKILSEWTIIGPNSSIRNVSRLDACYISNNIVIEGANKVLHSAFIGKKGKKTYVGSGSIISSSILKSGSRVADNSTVENSLLLDSSTVERHGKVIKSIISPNTSIAEGEVNASFVGPFTGFHHQSLLIAAYWPEGKGNIGYGANVGSNHTSRLPDQEIRIGEGVFFGLGCCIKFPANYEDAVYSIIATDVTTLPELVSLPFSLIDNNRKHIPDMPTGYNEIFPGWVIENNMYMLLRNERKYEKRDKEPEAGLPRRVFTLQNALRMSKARFYLQEASGCEIYYPGSITGMGKNIMTEKDRTAGIESYTSALRYYLLEAYFSDLDETHDSEFKKLWEDEGFTRINREVCVEHYIDCLTLIKDKIQNSRLKDYYRGEKIHASYMDFHGDYSEDPFIREIGTELNSKISKVRQGYLE